MKFVRTALLAMIMLTYSTISTGCWNYREVDRLAIVAGVAVDKGDDGQYEVTAEIVQISGGKESKTASKIITMKGRTMFDAVRNGISLVGKKLYWSHTVVIILSEETAKEGINKVLDWYTRDSEAREDVNVLISKAGTAKDIFSGKGVSEDIRSIELGEMIKNQKDLSKAPQMDILKFEIETRTKGISTIIPAIDLSRADDLTVPRINGAAVVKNDKLAGFLSGDETKALLFVRNEVKGGVLVEAGAGDTAATPVSLEIFKSRTKVTPVLVGENIRININIETTVAIDEIEGSRNYITEDGTKELERSAESALKEQVEAVIAKAQSKYDADIFGFGTKLRENKIKTWKSVSNQWDEVFRNLKVNVKAKVHIKNSAILSKTFEVGD